MALLYSGSPPMLVSHRTTSNRPQNVAQVLPRMGTRRLSDRTLKALKPAEGKRYELWDVDCPGLGVRVNSKGRKTFVLMTRYPGARHPERRTLGEYDAM